MKYSAPIPVSSFDQFHSFDLGQKLKRGDKIGIYAGFERVQTCACCPPTIKKFPIIIYQEQSGSIKREVIYELSPNRESEGLDAVIFGTSASAIVEKDDLNYEKYVDLLKSN